MSVALGYGVSSKPVLLFSEDNTCSLIPELLLLVRNNTQDFLGVSTIDRIYKNSLCWLLETIGFVTANIHLENNC